LFETDVTWCAISKPGETKRLGFASCEFLEPDRASSAPTPAPVVVPAPPPPAPLPAPRKHEAEPPPAPVAPAEFVDSILDGFGLRSAIANYTQTTRLLSFLDKTRLAEIDVAALDRVIKQQFQPAPFYAAIGEQLRKGYSPERLPELAQWIQSPLAQKLADLLRQAYSPDSRPELVEFAASLSKTPPSEARLLLIHRIYDASRTTDMQVEATIALVHTTALAIGPALPKEKRYGASELDRALGGVKSRYRAIMMNARLVQYLFAYRSAPDAELEQYADFLESGSGRWLISTVDKGFFEATGGISRQLRTEIQRNVKPRLH
jgi:hypothetical protein